MGEKKMMTTSKAVIYARESSDDTTKAPSIEEQIARGKQYAEEKVLKFIETYQDNGYSGGDWSRPDFNKLIRDAKFHKFNVVIVFSQDRIARDTEQFLWFYRNLKESSVALHSITEGIIDLENVGGLAQNVSLAMASHLFRKITSEKVKKTYDLKKRDADKKGEKVQWGRTSGHYNLEKIKQLRQQGLGFRAIAKQIGCSYQTIRRLLQNTPAQNNRQLNTKEKEKPQVTE
jgi:site-specific DNA recombinase